MTCTYTPEARRRLAGVDFLGGAKQEDLRGSERKEPGTRLWEREEVEE
jgi:hypothetical protein